MYGEWSIILSLVFLLCLTGAIAVLKVLSEHLRLQILNKVHRSINEISKLESIREICNTALKHIIEEFYADYVIISLIDFNERKIKGRYLHHKNFDSPDEEGLNSDFVFELDSQKFKDSKYFEVVNNPKKNVVSVQRRVRNTPTSDIHDLFYSAALKKNNLIRMYDKANGNMFAMTHRSQQLEVGRQKEVVASQPGDTVLGIIEVGRTPGSFRTLNISKFFNRKFWNRLWYHRLALRNLDIQMYIDNCAQPFYRALIYDKERELISGVLKDASNAHDPDVFLKSALKGLQDITRSDCSSISLKTKNFNTINFLEFDGLLNGYPLEDIDKELRADLESGKVHSGIFRKVIEMKKPFYDNKADDNDLFIKWNRDIKCELGVPLFRDNIGIAMRDEEAHEVHEAVGALVLSSRRENFYNKVQLETVYRFCNRITDIFFKKKLYFELGKLAKPYNVFAKDRQLMYKEISDALSSYFDSKYVALWERKNDFDRERIQFICEYGSQQDIKKTFKGKTISLERDDGQFGFDPSTSKALTVHQAKDLLKENTLKNFCTKHQFLSYIVLRIGVEKNYELFVDIFSKRRLPPDPSSEEKLFMKQISEKISSAIQSFNLVKAFKGISESLVKREGERQTLQELVNLAVEVLHADLVSLFFFDAMGRPAKKEPIFSNSYPDKFIGERSSFAEVVAKSRSVWIDDENDYTTVLNKETESTKPKSLQPTFWKEAGLQSVVALRLAVDDNPLAVMFFNFKQKKNWGLKKQSRQPDRVDFINSFGDWATVAILSLDILVDIEDEIRALNDRNGILKEETDFLKSKYAEANEQMEKLLPHAKAVSFLRIMEGMNHDLRTTFFGLRTTLKYLKGEAEMSSVLRRRIGKDIKAISKAITLVQNLLNLFKYEKLYKEVVGVSDLIKEVIMYFSNRYESIKFDLSGLGDAVPDMKCYKIELSMILYNLVNNAVQAIEEARDKGGMVRLSTNYDDDGYHIVVEDDGVGIDNEVMNRIFEPNFTTKKEGIGIGLYFVRETLHGEDFYGIIDCKSSRGKWC